MIRRYGTILRAALVAPDAALAGGVLAATSPARPDPMIAARTIPKVIRADGV